MTKKKTQFEKGHMPWNKGTSGIYSTEYKKKLSVANKGKKKPLRTKEHKKHLSEVAKGRKHSLETLKKMSISHVGYKCLPETKIKLSLASSKENNSQWLGGKSFEPYSLDWTRTLRRSIRERDRYTCQMCGEQQDNRAFCIHHIDYNKENCNPDNLITLCAKCHIRTNLNREYWKGYFYDRHNKCR